jgi:hypothetical protein
MFTINLNLYDLDSVAELAKALFHPSGKWFKFQLEIKFGYGKVLIKGKIFVDIHINLSIKNIGFHWLFGKHVKPQDGT